MLGEFVLIVWVLLGVFITGLVVCACWFFGSLLRWLVFVVCVSCFWFLVNLLVVPVGLVGFGFVFGYAFVLIVLTC